MAFGRTCILCVLKPSFTPESLEEFQQRRVMAIYLVLKCPKSIFKMIISSIYVATMYKFHMLFSHMRFVMCLHNAHAFSYMRFSHLRFSHTCFWYTLFCHLLLYRARFCPMRFCPMHLCPLAKHKGHIAYFHLNDEIVAPLDRTSI